MASIPSPIGPSNCRSAWPDSRGGPDSPHKVKKTLEAITIIEADNDLPEVRAALEHRPFGRRPEAEFGRGERTRDFMAVVVRFGPKTAIIADLAIAPAAA